VVQEHQDNGNIVRAASRDAFVQKHLTDDAEPHTQASVVILGFVDLIVCGVVFFAERGISLAAEQTRGLWPGVSDLIACGSTSIMRNRINLSLALEQVQHEVDRVSAGHDVPNAVASQQYKVIRAQPLGRSNLRLSAYRLPARW